MNEREMIIINCEQGAAEAINNEINGLEDCTSKLSQKHNLSGGLVEMIVLGTVALQALSQIIDFILELMEQNKKIKLIKIGKLEVKNPKPEDVRMLRKKYFPDNK